METNNLKKYIGKTFKGFKFESGKYNDLPYAKEMDEYIGKESTIIRFDKMSNAFKSNSLWWYPAELVIAQIEANEAQCDKDFRATQNAPQIVFNPANANEKPTFEVGELIHVWDSDEQKGLNRKRIFLFEKDGLFCCVSVGNESPFEKNNRFFTSFWKHAQKIPAKTKMSKQEFKEKFGVEFDNLIVE